MDLFEQNCVIQVGIGLTVTEWIGLKTEQEIRLIVHVLLHLCRTFNGISY